MWYVVQTLSGEEEKTADKIRKNILCYVKECFVPKRERMKKFHGCWHKVEEILFPGYIFVVTDCPGKLYQELKRISGLTKLLGREEECFFPLCEAEEKIVRGLANHRHMVPISEVKVCEGKTVQVLSGPLKDCIEDVVRVNLHKREAVVKVMFRGKSAEIYLGIEIAEGAG